MSRKTRPIQLHSHPLTLARAKRKLSQQGLADLVGLTKASISKYETGRGYPHPRLGFAIADVLRIRLEDVYAAAREAA